MVSLASLRFLGSLRFLKVLLGFLEFLIVFKFSQESLWYSYFLYDSLGFLEFCKVSRGFLEVSGFLKVLQGSLGKGFCGSQGSLGFSGFLKIAQISLIGFLRIPHGSLGFSGFPRTQPFLAYWTEGSSVLLYNCQLKIIVLQLQEKDSHQYTTTALSANFSLFQITDNFYETEC